MILVKIIKDNEVIEQAQVKPECIDEIIDIMNENNTTEEE